MLSDTTIFLLELDLHGKFIKHRKTLRDCHFTHGDSHPLHDVWHLNAIKMYA